MVHKVKLQIPNLFTLANLACGVLAILNIFNEELKTAAYLVMLAAIFDVFDGMLARLLKVHGEFGKQLDSLADLVTFGVAPSFMLYVLSENIDGYTRYAFIILALLSAYRLAKFNIDTRQTTSFIGVPTPITGIMCVSWAFLDEDISRLVFDNPWIYAGVCILISSLLLSKIHLPSLKLKKGPLRQHTQLIVIVSIGIIALIFYQWLCITVFYVAYVLSSVIIKFAKK